MQYFELSQIVGEQEVRNNLHYSYEFVDNGIND